MTGGIRGATTEGSSFIEGAWKGAVVGAVGGGLSMIGGAGMPFITNLALGTGSGALTGGLDAALWGNDIGKGMLWGAAGGAVFTSLTSENFSNMLKGEGFYTNENVFNNMIGRGAGKQEVLDHFKFEGTYDPDNVLFGGGGDPGITDPATGKIFYNDKAFAGGYDDLKLTVHHELRHQHDIFSGKYANIKLTREFKAGEEFATYLHNYKNQGLYPSHTYDLGTRMLTSATQAKLNPDMYFKYIFDSDRPWWHRIYQIPRRW